MAELFTTPEFFASRLERIEDMKDGNFRFWFYVDRTTPEGVHETEPALTLIMPAPAVANCVMLTVMGLQAKMCGALPMVDALLNTMQ